MISQQELDAMRRIKQEYIDLSNNPNPNIGVTVGLLDEDDIFNWRVTLLGPKDSSYKRGIFILSIHFPKDYPNSAPEVRVKTPIYHLNINPNISYMSGAEPLGHVCISNLNWWKPEYTIKEIITNIYGLFYMANPDSPYGLNRSQEYKYNRPLYESKIKFFTKKYADPRYCNIDKDYYESWDFSYNN